MAIRRSTIIGIGIGLTPAGLFFLYCGYVLISGMMRDAQLDNELKPMAQQWQEAYDYKDYDTAIAIANGVLARPNLKHHSSPWALRRGKSYLGRNKPGDPGRAVLDLSVAIGPQERGEAYLLTAVCLTKSGAGNDAARYFDASISTGYDRKAIADAAMALVEEYRSTYPGLASIAFAAAAKAQPHLYAVKAKAFDKANGF